MDQGHYAQVLAACGLDQDIVHMAAGDATGAGSAGAALSGGQCARIALARALCQVPARSRACNSIRVLTVSVVRPFNTQAPIIGSRNSML